MTYSVFQAIRHNLGKTKEIHIQSTLEHPRDQRESSR